MNQKQWRLKSRSPIREAAKKRKGQIPWNKGKKMSKEFCEKVSKLTKIAMNKLKTNKKKDK